MTAPTFKKASDTTPGGPTKHGSQDINYGWNVLDGTHSTDRVQVQNIERVTNPWNYYIYKDSTGTTYARRGDTGRAEFSHASNSFTVLESALAQSQTEYSKSIIVFAPQTFSSGTGAGTTITLVGRNNVSLIGSGMEKTILQSLMLEKNNSTPTSNFLIQDLTMDCQGNVPHALHLGTNISNIRVHNFWGKDSYSRATTPSGFIMQWSQVDGMVCTNSIFTNMLDNPWDNCSGSQEYDTENEAVFRNCYFEKGLGTVFGASQLGCMLSLGSTCGNVLVDGCTMRNSGDTNSTYAALSAENNDGNPSKDVRIVNCRGYGPKMGYQVGNDDTDVFRNVVISNTLTYGLIRISGAETAICANNTIRASHQYGYYITANKYAYVTNCSVKNTNLDNLSTTDKGGMWAKDNKYLVVDGFSVYDDQATATTPYGMRLTQTTVPSNEIRLNNIQLIGPWATAGFALRIDNTAKVRINGGKIVGSTSFNSNTDTAFKISDLDGFNPQGLATVTLASGATYTNNDRVAETIYMTGGTITAMTKNGTSIGIPGAVRLEPGDTFVPTYTGSPTIVKDRQ